LATYSFRISRHLRFMRLAEGTEKIAGGDLDVYIEPVADDELGVLVRSFNEMALDLRRGREEILRVNLDLESRRRYMETVLKNIAAGVLALDPRGKVTTVNDSAVRLLGIEQHSPLGKPLLEVLPEVSGAPIREALDELATSPLDTVERQVTLSFPEGVLSLICFGSSLRDEEGHDLGVVLVLENMTHLIKAQRMAAWREVARRIAHEIKNPMVSIKTFTQLFPERYEDEEFRSTFYQLASHEIDRINTLVEHLLNLAKPANVTYEPISLPRVLREVLAMLETEFQQRQIRLIHDFQDEHVKSPADFRQMKQVFLNILLNAKESIQNGGTIEVRSCLARGPAESESGEFVGQSQHYLVQVADSGGGIAPEDLPHIFDPFFTTKTAGNGLGLSITHKIVTDHGGAITVDSGPGRTVFSVWLPIIFEEALVES